MGAVVDEVLRPRTFDVKVRGLIPSGLIPSVKYYSSKSGSTPFKRRLRNV